MTFEDLYNYYTSREYLEEKRKDAGLGVLLQAVVFGIEFWAFLWGIVQGSLFMIVIFFCLSVWFVFVLHFKVKQYNGYVRKLLKTAR